MQSIISGGLRPEFSSSLATEKNGRFFLPEMKLSVWITLQRAEKSPR